MPAELLCLEHQLQRRQANHSALGEKRLVAGLRSWARPRELGWRDTGEGHSETCSWTARLNSPVAADAVEGLGGEAGLMREI